MNQSYDVCIIGGGAAGLAAAASIDSRFSTCILEKNEILGRKILATGGGRCNLTNAGCRELSATLDFFALLGLETRRDSEGRYYPYSGCASDVVRTLETAVRSRNCAVMTGCQVSEISADKEGFEVRYTCGTGKPSEGMIRAGRVLLTTGGKAGPQFGTTGDGYRLARALGHQVSRLYPILTGIECGDFKDLKGIRARGTVTLIKDGRKLADETGEIQFTRDGISGICVFNLTPLIRAGEGEKPEDAFRRYELALDLAPDFTQEETAARQSSFGILTERLAERVPPDMIKDWRLPVLGIKGWRDAQCTAGGVTLDSIDMESMESKLVPGLYFAGEILDIQGPCGGYNLQNAWETGMRAAAAINRQKDPGSTGDTETGGPAAGRSAEGGSSGR